MKLVKFNSILLVDDDDITNFINKHTIKSLKITDNIIIARNGKEGLDFLEDYAHTNNSLPELIFVDLNMPLIDGFEFVQRLIQSGLKDKFKSEVIVLTTSTNLMDKGKFQELGIKYYLNKPLSKESLSEVLARISLKPIVNTFGIPIIPPDEDKRMEAVK